jgi:hypothetical protein
VEFTGAITFLEHKVPGLVIGAVRNGERAIAGFGTTSTGSSAVPDGKTIFRIGSVTKLLRRGNFATKKDLRTKIEQFIAYFNATMAKPFRWTYAGKPLAGAGGAIK